MYCNLCTFLYICTYMLLLCMCKLSCFGGYNRVIHKRIKVLFFLECTQAHVCDYAWIVSHPWRVCLCVCLCLASSSYQWYSWGPPNMQCRLCASCWTYWKKYGGLKMPTRLEGERPGPNRNNMVHSKTCTCAHTHFTGYKVRLCCKRIHPPLKKIYIFLLM